jgi:CBS domain-containing protein
LYPTAIYDALLEQDGVPPLKAAAPVDGLSAFRVRDAMTTELVTLWAEDTLEEAARRIADLPYSIYPVLDRQGRLVGLVSESRIRRRLAAGQGGNRLREYTRPRDYLQADTPLVEAVLHMNRVGARQMAVVDDDNELSGMLAMSDVMRAHVQAAARADPNAPPLAAGGGGPRRAVRWRRHDSTAGFRRVEADSDKPPPADPSAK